MFDLLFEIIFFTQKASFHFFLKKAEKNEKHDSSYLKTIFKQ